MDTVKVAPGLYQYTAIDDCSRFVVAELYPKRTAAHTLAFLELVSDSFAVPVQCIETDHGTEFMAFKVRLRLHELCIKFRPNKPASPRLDGKVEHVQQTIQRECYASLDVNQADLADELSAWLMYYNYQRVHGSLGTTPLTASVNVLKRLPYGTRWLLPTIHARSASTSRHTPTTSAWLNSRRNADALPAAAAASAPRGAQVGSRVSAANERQRTCP